MNQQLVSVSCSLISVWSLSFLVSQCLYGYPLPLKVASEDAARVVVVMELGARDDPSSLDLLVDLCSQEHSQWRRREIDPERRELMRAKCRAKCARRVHAHAGKW